jgi:hypothetical protein
MLSGMFGLLSVDCAKAAEATPATASATALVNVGRKLRGVFEGRYVSHVTALAISAGSIAGEASASELPMKCRNG